MHDSERAFSDLTAEGFTAAELHEEPRILARRVAQQQLISQVPGIVQLEAAGSQAREYVHGPDGRPSEVLYASYGSNLSAGRFQTYLQGGWPAGSARMYSGARDTRLPAEDLPVALRGTVHYAGDNSVWTGGAAFLDPSTTGHSLGRAYRITAEQFDDVVAQECGQEAGSKYLNLNEVIACGQSSDPGLYGRLIHVGDHGGLPVFTFTGPFSTRDSRSRQWTVSAGGVLVGNRSAEARRTSGRVRPYPVFPSAPSPAYRAMISAGLRDTHGLTAAETVTYFAGATGVEQD